MTEAIKPSALIWKKTGRLHRQWHCEFPQTATEAHWCGQLGEWWSAKLASPAWELYRKKGLVGDKWPDPEKPQQEGSVSYHLRTGKHFLTPYDWGRYMDFADKHGWQR